MILFLMNWVGLVCRAKTESRGRVRIPNPHIARMNDDFLYHIGLSKTDDLPKKFGDVKFVCFGGAPSRMEKFATYVVEELGLGLTEMKNLSCNPDRYVMYKAGPVLSVSHGIGVPSVSIIFEEVLKLLHYSKCDEDVKFFRIGTCGGIGVKGGTVIVSNKAVDGALRDEFRHIVLGKDVTEKVEVDQEFAEELYSCKEKADEFETVKGTTLYADDFYEGQGRIDGAFCDHTEDDKMVWLRSLAKSGVKNIEMESGPFFAYCQRAGVKGAVVNVALLNRLEGDGVFTKKEILKAWEDHPQILVARYIKKNVSKNRKFQM